ncbi:hypothetical protein S40293_00442 [Stachybotrys chartarum IBT 40293]|nr:hypothetical protein S40293_00442 [Stachybotrys chartarum IBT 40293]
MTSSASWYPLAVGRSSDLPVLLAFMDMGTAAYTVRITDTANVWEETLDRKAICIRGWAENTSIDPSDTPDNMARFLGCLRSALDPSQPGHECTSLTLSPAQTDDAGDGGLTLKVTCRLTGVQPLTWPFHLKKSPPSAIATELVLPLVQAHHVRKQEVDSLIEALHHKDAVLSKVLDKLEAVGTGLEHVFNSLSGKKVPRSQAEKSVQGLAPFDQAKWKRDIASEADGVNTVSDLIHDVFGRGHLPLLSSIKIGDSSELDRWWHHFRSITHTPVRSQVQSLTGAEEPGPSNRKDTLDEDEEFQVQITPPRLTLTRKLADKDNMSLPHDVSTESEEEDSKSHHPSSPISRDELKETAHTRPVLRLGSLGPKPSVTGRNPSPPPMPSPGKDVTMIAVDDDETASEADEDVIAPIPDKLPSPSAKTTPPKGGLGRIGKKKPEPQAPPKEKTPEPKVQDDGISPGSIRTHTPRKLGVVGKRPGGSSPAKPAAEADTERGRRRVQRVEPESEGEPRETSQERADRIREKLKRDLEKKAAAGPTKKKRRF